jgi:hypothetical protein
LSRNLPAGIALIAAVIVIQGFAFGASGDGPATDATSGPSEGGSSAAASQPPDKWQYNLFNPTPTDLLSGMDSDRPNITNTPHTIDAGHLQIETGVNRLRLFP